MSAPDPKPLFERITLIGSGLIGSSIARVVKLHNLAGEITVVARSQSTLDTMADLGLTDKTTLDLVEAVKNADLIILCTPLGTYKSIAKAIGSSLKSGAIISDVGSCKNIMFTDVGPYLSDKVHMVPGHPIAGTEHSGPKAGTADLFKNRWCILTPGPGANITAVNRVAELWRQIGTDVEIMDANHHDQVLALTSHLPHLIAYTIVGTATDLEDDLKKEVLKYSASGFRDFTRIASSDPIMWRDIFLKNKDAVLNVLGRFTEDLISLQSAIQQEDSDKLEDHFSRTRTIRRGIIDANQE
jgi:cyclohexadieny/prephenate dehydrogenase